MPIVNWRVLPAFTAPAGQVIKPWLLAFDSLGDGTHVRIEADGEFLVSGDGMQRCGPDGLTNVNSIDKTRLLISDCPLGALLGKIGGSSALFSAVEKPNSTATAITEGQPFAIGAHLIATLPAKSIGQLYVGFNDLRRPVEIISLTVTASVATPTF